MQMLRIDSLILRAMLLPAACAFAVFSALADDAAKERRDTIELQEVSITTAKVGGALRRQPVASTLIGRKAAEELNINALRGISDVVPNFYIPDYGSRITSSIYVRGLGARMDQPAVGLNVDNVPYLNKDAYDFDIADIARVEMLRGPQSTLYGRNTMGGLINISTLSPLTTQGVRGIAEYGSANTWRLGAGWYGLTGESSGVAVNAVYMQSDGFFRNEYNGRKLDHEKQFAMRAKYDARLSSSFSLMNAASFSLLRQGGYPYEQVATGRIAFNDTCFYRRLTFTDGLTARWQLPGATLTSVTSVQYIDDNMTLDQDFTDLPYFTLTQKKREWALTEEVVARGSAFDGRYSWIGGVFVFGKRMHMLAPVTFKSHGISVLIEDHRNSSNPHYPIEWNARAFVLNSDFTIPTFGAAIYHESKLSLGRWELRAGVRLDYERASMKYRSWCNTGYTIYQTQPDESRVPYREVPINIDDAGRLKRDFTEVLPSFGAVYTFGQTGNVYASISKGYKAGGFNTQMFSDVLQQRLMNIMGISASYDINEVVGYKPEKSWNYEVGSHLSLADGSLLADISAFYIDCTDQQLTMFPDGTTTGRIMTNAGRTRSFGAEVSLDYTPARAWTLRASYGYTNARFRRFFNGREDFRGRYLPYAPQHTIFAQVLYHIAPRRGLLRGITLDLNARGVGKIYWNESNTISQPLYALLNAVATFEFRRFDVQIWGHNLTGTHYDTFYFMSIGNEFLQRGKPASVGVTVRLHI